MNEVVKTALSGYLLSLADDELILGHRDSEWCAHGPILEEDIAFANLALDEIGHASLWYGLYAGLRNEDLDTYPDKLVFQRGAENFRNAQIVELPNGDWAFTILRHYLFDAAELARLEGLAESKYSPVAEAASKIQKEEIYHHRHTRAWVQRLGLGTEESHRRIQVALNGIWPYSSQLFSPQEGERLLVDEGMVPPSDKTWEAWKNDVLPFLQTCNLIIPAGERQFIQRGHHTPGFTYLVAEMQSVFQADPGASW